MVVGLRGARESRLASIIGGVAGAIFGALALSWPDVTLLVVAVLFGARTTMFGLRWAWWSHRGHLGGSEPVAVRQPGRARGVGHLVGVSVALVAALVLAGVSVTINRSRSSADAFYDTPEEVPDQPGSLLDLEVFTRHIPEGARAHRILYTTTREDGRPAVASALVVVPADEPGPWPVIAWAHGTTGFDRACAPSVMRDGLGAGAFFSLDAVLAQGWALVATDYVGLGTEGPHPYLIGEGEARSVLDAVRAARQMEEVDIADQTVVWGHSQGGGAALWTGQIAPDYAPDVVVAGVAALAPASDLTALVDSLPGITGGSIFASYIVAAYAATYDDLSLDDLVRPTAKPTFERMSSRCLDATVLVSALSSVATGMDMFAPDVVDRLYPRLDENVPTGPFEMPLLVGQGRDDTLIPADLQGDYVKGLCEAGEEVDYRTYPGRGHVPLVEADSPLIPELIEWTDARFRGEPTGEGCGGT